VPGHRRRPCSEGRLFLDGMNERLLDPTSQQEVLELIRRCCRPGPGASLTSLWITAIGSKTRRLRGAPLMTRARPGPWAAGRDLRQQLEKTLPLPGAVLSGRFSAQSVGSVVERFAVNRFGALGSNPGGSFVQPKL